MSHAGYPVIDYNPSTGSNTNPSDCVSSSANTGVTAFASAVGSSIRFEFGESELESLDLSACADDDSDYIYCDTVAGDRHLFRITAFSPSKGACTSITIDQTLDATFTGAAWHINGTRASFHYDGSHPDPRDWHRGWTIRLNGTFAFNNVFEPAYDDAAARAVDDPELTIMAHPNATSKPIIRTTASWAYMYRTRQRVQVKNIGLRYETTGNGANNYMFLQHGAHTFVDCDIVNNSSTQPTYLLDVASGLSARFFNCYISGGGTRTIRGDGLQHLIVDNCWIDCKGTYGTGGALYLGGENNVVTNTLISESAERGIVFDVGGNEGRKGFWFCKNVTIADCASHGIQLTGTPTATDDPEHTFAILNCLVAGNGGYGIDMPQADIHVESGDIDFNCLFNNTSGGYNHIPAGGNDVTITTTPFSDAANDDYSLNATATGGALLIAAARMTLPTGT